MSSRLARVASVVCASALFGQLAVAQTSLLHLQGSAAGDAYGVALKHVSASYGFAPIHLCVIGVPNDATNGADAGRVDVRSATTGALLYSVYGAAPGDHFGVRVAEGDINGDGRIDYLLVGANQRGTGGTGYVAIFDPVSGTLLNQVDGTVADSEFGSSIVVLGDLDGDGVNDYAVGAPNEDSGALTQAGAVHILSGVNDAEIGTLFGSASGANFGMVNVRLGDVDGDGTADFAVSAPRDGKTGSVTVFSQTLPPVFVWQATGSNSGEDFGQVDVVADDLDGDGVADMVIGAPALDDPTLPGRIALLSGASGKQIIEEPGTNPGDEFGRAIGIGDYDGDGMSDLYVGAPGMDGAGTDRGGLLVYTMMSPGVFQYQLTIEGSNDGDAFATTLAILPISPRPVLGDYLAVGLPGHDEPGLADIGEVIVGSTTDCPASSQNYGTGWPGTLGIPGLTASGSPAFETDLSITIDNSAPNPTIGLLLVGFVAATIPTKAGGDILVSPPWLLHPVALPVGQLVLTGPVPTDVRYCGLEIDMQCLELDPGTPPRNISFTPGLQLILGG